MKLIRDKRNKKDGPSQFVPTNMAVNFVQHNRCKYFKTFKQNFNLYIYIFLIPVNIEVVGSDGKRNYKQQRATKQAPSDEKTFDKRKKKDNATDDFHYERFKKQFRRY